MDECRICGKAEFNAIFLRLRWKLEDFDQNSISSGTCGFDAADKFYVSVNVQPAEIFGIFEIH